MSASIICQAAAAMLERGRRTGGSARRTKPRPPAFASLTPADLRLAARILTQRRLRRRKPRDRHAERRARYVVQIHLVAERDRRRIAAVLAADADLEAL